MNGCVNNNALGLAMFIRYFPNLSSLNLTNCGITKTGREIQILKGNRHYVQLRDIGVGFKSCPERYKAQDFFFFHLRCTRRASILIQKAWRNKVSWEVKKSKATHLQKMYRGYSARRKLAEERYKLENEQKIRSAIRIQCFIRMCTAKQMVQEKRNYIKMLKLKVSNAIRGRNYKMLQEIVLKWRKYTILILKCKKLCHKIRMKFARKCYKLWDLQANDTRRKRNKAATMIQSIVRRYLAIRKVFLRLHILNWERRNNAIELIQRWWRGEKVRYDMWIMRLNIIASGSFESWKQYSDEVNDKTSRSKKLKRQYKKGDSFQYKERTMETWPPQHFDYLVNDPDDWKTRSSLQSNLYESKMFQCWCIRKIRSSIGIAALAMLDAYIDIFCNVKKGLDTQKKTVRACKEFWQLKLDHFKRLNSQMKAQFGISTMAPGLHREELYEETQQLRKETEEARNDHQLASCKLEDSKSTLKAILSHLDWFRILVGRWLRGSIFLLSLDNLETRHFVTCIATREEYNLPYYPGMDTLIDNLHIDLTVGKPVKEIVLKLVSVFGTDNALSISKSNDIKVINQAAATIQKIVRGWNIRKISSLERYREWGGFSSIASSSAFTPRSEVSFIGTPEKVYNS